MNSNRYTADLNQRFLYIIALTLSNWIVKEKSLGTSVLDNVPICVSVCCGFKAT